MRIPLGLLLACLLPVAALAGSPQVEETMVVPGTLILNPDGSVRGYTVHDPDQLPAAVRTILQQTIPKWAFVPVVVDGKAVAAQTGMYVRVVADFIDRDHARIRVAGAEFGCAAWQTRKAHPDACPRNSAPSYAHRPPPTYPMAAARSGVGGLVLLVVRIGRDGKVINAAVRQVDLYNRTYDPNGFRAEFAAASLHAARRWHFNTPTAGPDAAKPYWDVTVPINFMVRSDAAYACGRQRRYGQWCGYLPGPVDAIPWRQGSTAAGAGAGAIADGAPFLRDPRFVLRNGQPAVAG